MNLNDLAWPQVRDVARRAVAILPLGATEQHGPHLAVSTDSCLITHLAAQAEAARPREVVVCPTLSYGASHHHLGFPGTMSIGSRLYAQVAVDLAMSLVTAGFRRIVLLNGHGGNIVPCRQALSQLSEQLDDRDEVLIALASYWELAGAAFAGAPPMESPALSHACEYETSMMLHLFPERVNLGEACRAKRPPPNGYVPWEDEHPGRGVAMVKKTHFISSNGSSGEPQKATAAKGRHLLEKATAAVIQFVDDFQTWTTMEDLRDGQS